MGVGHYYPGLDPDVGRRISAKHGEKMLPGTTDAPESRSQANYIGASTSFAAKYNKKKVSLIKHDMVSEKPLNFSCAAKSSWLASPRRVWDHHAMPTVFRYVLAVVSGLTAAAAFPNLGWWPLILLAWPILFVALRGAGPRHGCYLGWVQGMACYATGLSWMVLIFAQGAHFLWLVLAVFGLLAGALTGWASSHHARWPWLPLSVALAWSALEFVRAELSSLAFPWMTTGLGLGPTWLSPWIGVYGAGFLVFLAAGMLVFGGKRQRAAGLVLTVLLGALGVFRPGPVMPTGRGIPVLAVQSESCDFFTYLAMTEAQVFADGIILWPEYAATNDLQREPASFAKAVKLANDRNATLILGSQKDFGGDAHYNEALTIESTGLVGTHDKNHPVPFLNDGKPGRLAVPVTTRFGRIGTPICFDCDFAGPVRRMTAAGAEAFAVPSLDAVRWGVKQHAQHAELFRHRALENGRWMLVCATSGLTQLIDPHGNRVAQIPMLKDGILTTTLHPCSNLTFFTRCGWLCPWLLCAAALAFTARLWWRATHMGDNTKTLSHNKLI